MSDVLEPYRRLFLPTDLEDGTEIAYHHALRLALAEAGTLHVVHVHDPDVAPSWAHLPNPRELLARWGRLSDVDDLDGFEGTGIRIAFSSLASLELEPPVERAIAQERPDLLVLPTHARRGIERLRMPSVAEDLARHAGLPALFVPRDARPFVDPDNGGVMLRRIVVPVGNMEDARAALREAMRLVSSYDAAPCEFVLVHNGRREDMPPLFLADDDPRWSFRVDIRGGGLVEEVLASVVTHDADAIVMATRGHDTVLDWVRGSKSEIVVRNSPVPVMTVPVG